MTRCELVDLLFSLVCILGKRVIPLLGHEPKGLGNRWFRSCPGETWAGSWREGEGVDRGASVSAPAAVCKKTSRFDFQMNSCSASDEAAEARVALILHPHRQRVLITLSESIPVPIVMRDGFECRTQRVT